ncbi:hypothetical protein BDV25DRAFT_155030 [Aspergillus avenaceus]|uniref:Uncharacterized protein n=1 Tax=Aspergillus avenaceus TaxID=36643 RepID=A0A5N6TUP6_ASPAV|nr:hypothetical protein BDV25DRAFT_155030 [Aspergillus avenaceus]
MPSSKPSLHTLSDHGPGFPSRPPCSIQIKHGFLSVFVHVSFSIIPFFFPLYHYILYDQYDRHQHFGRCLALDHWMQPMFFYCYYLSTCLVYPFSIFFFLFLIIVLPD